MKDRFELKRNDEESRYDILLGSDAFYVSDELVEKVGTEQLLKLMLERFRETCIAANVLEDSAGWGKR